MASIPLSDLEPGCRLAYDLLDPDGRLLLAARRPVSDEVLRALHRRGVSDLIFREPEENDDSGQHRTWLMAGVADLGDEKRSATEPEQQAAPAPQKPKDIQPPPSITHIRAGLRRAADGVITTRSPRWNRLSRSIEPETFNSSFAFAQGASGEGLSAEARHERAELVGRIFTRLSSGQPVGMGVIAPLIDELIEDARRDPLAFVRTAIESASETDDLATHAYAVASVCSVIAVRLGWSDSDVRSAGLAGLLADCGLTLLPWDIRSEPRPLTDVETNALHRHTAWSAAMLELIDDDEHTLDEIVQLAVYQHHEREDGTGYPTRARSDSIHDLSRLVAVADTFVGLLSPRAHRPGLGVEGALAEVVRAASAGTLARTAARGLVLALGLEPSTARAPAVVTRTTTHRIAA